ncbi:hypothetical protein M885DRAFT_523925 [Pelagophyceae sp. CCMP2097]|nr:hypothetical protein M885DRAFT_523925 [Pelagophyceae sp. CCMP2097]
MVASRLRTARRLAVPLCFGFGSVSALQPRKTFLITGATDGIGRFTAMQLGRDGHHVLVHGRNAAKVAKAVADVEAAGGTADGLVADLSLVSETKRLGLQVAQKYASLDGLLNNAGTFDGDYTGSRVVTAEGHEYSLAVNVLAPFVLTSYLLENVRKSGAGRILLTSSMSMGEGSSLDDLEGEKRWSAHGAYSLSKLCDAMIAFELSARYADARLCVNTFDPGTVNTKMLASGWGNCGIPVSSATRSYKMLTEEEWGTKTGQCFGASPDREVRDPALRKKLWADLERLTGAKYPPP